jgi:hypothetical protein
VDFSGDHPSVSSYISPSEQVVCTGQNLEFSSFFKGIKDAASRLVGLAPDSSLSPILALTASLDQHCLELCGNDGIAAKNLKFACFVKYLYHYNYLFHAKLPFYTSLVDLTAKHPNTHYLDIFHVKSLNVYFYLPECDIYYDSPSAVAISPLFEGKKTDLKLATRYIYFANQKTFHTPGFVEKPDLQTGNMPTNSPSPFVIITEQGYKVSSEHVFGSKLGNIQEPVDIFTTITDIRLPASRGVFILIEDGSMHAFLKDYFKDQPNDSCIFLIKSLPGSVSLSPGAELLALKVSYHGDYLH